MIWQCEVLGYTQMVNILTLERQRPAYTKSSMTSDDIAMSGATVSATLVLKQFHGKVPVSAPEGSSNKLFKWQSKAQTYYNQSEIFISQVTIIKVSDQIDPVGYSWTLVFIWYIINYMYINVHTCKIETSDTKFIASVFALSIWNLPNIRSTNLPDFGGPNTILPARKEDITD